MPDDVILDEEAIAQDEYGSESEGEAGEEVAVEGDEDGFDDELISMAKQFGIPESAARAFDSPQKLSDTLLTLAEAEDEKDNKAGSASAAKDDVDKEEEIVPYEFKIKIPEDADPDLAQSLTSANQQIAEAMNKLREGSQAENQALKLQVRRLEELASAQAGAAFEQRLDNWINHLEGYEEVFGKGSSADLSMDSLEYENRLKLVKAAKRIDRGYKTGDDGERVPSEAAILKEALGSVFSDKASSVAAKKISAKLRSRKSQMVSRPTKRRSNSDRSGTDKAVERVEKFHRDRGMSVEERADLDIGLE